MGSGRVVEPVEGIHFFLPGLRRVAEADGRALADPAHGNVHGRTERLQIVSLREVDRQLRRRPIRQGHLPIIPEEVLDHVAHVGFGPSLEVEGLDIARDVLEDAVADALGEPIPDHHVLEGLAIEVRGAGGVHDGDHVGARRQVIHRLPDLLQPGFERLAIRVVGLVREDGQVGERADGLEPEVGDLGAGLVLPAPDEEVPEVALPDLFLLDPDLLRVRHHHVEEAPADDGDVLLAVPGEGELY